MDSLRLTSISRKNLGTPTPSTNKRLGSRSLAPDQPRTVRSKTPQPPGPRSKPRKSKSKHKPSPRSPQKSPRLLQYRARKDSESQKEIEEELPDYIKATTPQPHSFGMKPKKRKSGKKNHKNNDLMMPPINLLQRSKSNDRSPHSNHIPEIPQFKPNIPNPNQPDVNRDTSMFTFVKSQFEPDMGFNNRARMDSNSSSSQYSNYSNYSAPANHNGYQQYTNQQVPQIPIIMANNNTTPIPMNQLPPHQDDHNFNAQKIHNIPKPPPPKRISPRSVQPALPSKRRDSDSEYRSRANSNSSAGGHTLLSPQEMRDGVDQILSHYEQAGSRKNSATSTFVANLNRNGSNNNRKGSDSYSQSQSQSHLRKKTPFQSGSNSQGNSPKDVGYKHKGSPRDKSDWKSKMGFGKKKKSKKVKKDKESPRKRNSRSKSHKSPFNDEDDRSDEEYKGDTVMWISKDHIFKNKLHPANRSGPHLQAQKTFQPLAPPKSSPSVYTQQKEIPQIHPNPNPVQSLHPIVPPRSFVMPLNNANNKPKMRPSMGNRSYSDKNVVSIAPNPYPLNDINSSLHQHIKTTTPVPRPRSSANSGNRPKSRTVGDYEDQNYQSDDFMDDREVAHKSVAYDRSLRKQRGPNGRGGNSDDDDVDFGNNEQYQRMMDKMRFKCDQLDWNLNSLQTSTDKDIRQITAKMHRVEHDMKTQNELFNRSHRKNGHGRKNSIFNSLESSITAVMRNVDSIKDALQTLDLRMSIINQRQHDIFKHIDETKEILENAPSQPIASENDESKSGGNGGGTSTLVLNALDKESLINSRRASLQSMSEMLRLQSTRSMSRQEEFDENNNIIQFNNNDKNPLILPTYDDNEDILHNASPTKRKLMGHIRPELLLQAQKSVNGPSGRTTILPNPKSPSDQFVIQKDKSHDITLSMVSSTGSGSGDYGVVIERTVTTPIYGIGPQLQGLHGINNDILSLQSKNSNRLNNNISDVLSLQKDSNNNLTTPKNMMQLHSIEEKDDGDSTESELSLERNTAPISVPPMGSDNEQQPETERQTSFSRRKGHKPSSRRGSKSKHNRSSIDSGLSEHIVDQIRSETMLIHSDSEENRKFVAQLQQEDDEKAMEYNNKPPGDDDVDEEKQYTMNKENRRKNKRKKSHHKRSMNHSIDDEVALNTMDMKTLEMPLPGTMEKPKVSDSRKYSESYSININQQHAKNSTTHGGTLLKSRITPRQKEPSIFDAIGVGGGNRDRLRAGSMSYDAIEPNIKYEREVSRSDGNSGLINDLDPLSFGRNQQDKLRNQSVQAPLLAAVTDSDNENDEDEDESSMSALSEEHDNGTFIIHGDTLKEALDKEKLKQQQKQYEDEQSISKNSKKSDESTSSKRRKSRKKQMIQLMNCDFVLEKVPNEFTIINNFIIRELTSKPSYLLTICNNTTSHDLFFKTCNIYQSRSKKLRFFKECDISNGNENKNDDDIIIIDENQDSDDHLAPMEDMTFGDICVKKGIHYCGYFVFEAYPFITNTTHNSDGGDGRSRHPSTVITPHSKPNPITPQLKLHATLGAIDEKKRNIQQTFNQLTELNLNSLDPSTVNKYRRQSISSNASSRRTSLQFLSPKKGLTLSDRVNIHSNSSNYGHNHQNNTYEPSVTSLLGRALDEEQNGLNDAGLPWNDELDDLVDIIVGYSVVLSVGDAELNQFKFFVQFNDYQQPLFYQNKLYDINALKSFCNGGGDGLQCRGGINNSILLKCNINDKDSTHPQIQFNIGYTPKDHHHDSSQDELSQLSRNTNTTNPETFDID